MPARRPRGTGHVYQRGNVWWIAYHVRGKLVRESTGTPIKSDAERVLRARTGAVDSGLQTDPAAMRTTLADLRAIVQADYQNNGRAGTREVARSYDRLADHFGAGCLARRIDAAAVEGYKRTRLEAGARPATVNRELAMLRRGFRLAVRYGKVAARPDFSLLTENNARAGFFEAEQFEALTKHTAADLRPLLTFLYWTGWRRSEAQALEWRQVDTKAGIIRIEKTKNRTPRTIPYAVVPELKRVIEEQRALTTALERERGSIIPSVFHRNGKPITSFMGAWHVACAKAGLAGRIPHDLRRTAARNMLRAGIPQQIAMQIGGWKTNSVFTRYAIVDEALLREGMAKLGARA